MSSKKNDFFGGFFDFNGDGKTDIGEEWIAYQIFQECMKDEKSSYKPHTSSANKKKKTTQIINKKAPLPEIYTEEELNEMIAKAKEDAKKDSEKSKKKNNKKSKRK